MKPRAALRATRWRETWGGLGLGTDARPPKFSKPDALPASVPAEDRESFWRQVKRYRELGLDPLKWIAGCSVEVDAAEVVLPGAAQAREALAALSATLQLSEGPDVFEAREQMPAALRAVVRPGDAPQEPRSPTRTNPNRAAIMMRVLQRKADKPDEFAAALVAALSGLPSGVPRGGSLNAPFSIGQLHAVTTIAPEAEFSAFEFFPAGSGAAIGYGAVRCASLQIADATLEPLADEHAATVVSAALASCCALGATQGAELYPIFDGPGGKARDSIAASFAAEARKHGLTLRERPPLGLNALFYGATVVAKTDREPPNRHHYVKRGMQITITRPFGDLAPLAAYLSCLSDPDYEARAKGAGLSLDDLARRCALTVSSLTSPALAAGKVIHDYSAPFREPPELREHVVATADLGPDGVVGLAALARRFEVQIDVEQLPLADPEVARFATEAHLMDNATASAPGAIAIVAYPSVLDGVERALEEAGQRPARIGTIAGRGPPTIRVPAAAFSGIASKRLRSALEVRAA